MNLIGNKNYQRRIGPKIGEKNEPIANQQSFKPRLYENKIDFDRMRMYRLNRVRDQLVKHDVGACILFDPINIRYATDTRNMSLFAMHIMTRYLFVPASGPVILFEYPKCANLSKDFCTVDEVRFAETWDYFSAGENLNRNAKRWANIVDDLMKMYVSENKVLAIDTIDPVAMESLTSNFSYKIIHAQKFMETARCIKSEDEIMCMRASLKTAEKGISKIYEELKAGITEEELWSFLHKTNIENGGEWIETRLLASGQRTNPWFQECSNRIIQKGDIVAFDTDMVGPYGYCADISRTFVEGHKLNDKQKRLHDLALENIKHNEKIIKNGTTFLEFAEKAWKLPENCFDNHYPCQVHGVGMCDEYPCISYPNEDFSNGDFSGIFQKNMIISVESYIGEVGGKEGVKLEDEYLITDNGLELLSSYPLDKV